MKKILILTSMVCSFLFLWASVFAIDVQIGKEVANDPYFEMNGANLNTMNSYILPTKNDINPETYMEDSEWKYKIEYNNGKFALIKDTTSWYKAIHIMSTYLWYILLWCMMFVIWFFGVRKKDSGFGQLLRLAFEGVWWFFEDILWRDRKHWIKVYVVSLFFIILFANLFGLVNDILRFIFPQYLRRVTSPTGEFESTIAFALIATVLTLYVQSKNVWWPHKLILEYVPVMGKWLVEWKWIWARLWDFVISMFIWFLDIVGVIAKVVSLSIRLFWNMSSWSILLNVIFIGIGMMTVNTLWFNFAIWLPIIIYIQSLLSSVIQAFVFSLLVGIGIAMVDE